MAKSKRAGKAYVSSYARYKSGNIEALNRKRKLEKLQLKQPNNEQIPLAIKNIRHRRFTPKAPYWSSSMIRIAKIVKQFTGMFDKNYFSTDADLYNVAIRSRKESKFKEYVEPKAKGSMYSIRERTGWI